MDAKKLYFMYLQTQILRAMNAVENHTSLDNETTNENYVIDCLTTV